MNDPKKSYPPPRKLNYQKSEVTKVHPWLLLLVLAIFPLFIALKSNPEDWFHYRGDTAGTTDAGAGVVGIDNNGAYRMLSLTTGGAVNISGTINAAAPTNAVTDTQFAAYDSFMRTGTVNVAATFSGGASETNAVAFFNFMKTGTVNVAATFSGGFTETNGTARLGTLVAQESTQQKTTNWLDLINTKIANGTNIDQQILNRLLTGPAAPTNSTAITAASLPLPSNAAQETGGNLASILTQSQNSTNWLQQIYNRLIAGPAAPTNTTAISAASLPLPSGASTEATLASILTAMQNMTNYASPYTRFSFWNPSAAISSNIVSASAATLGHVTVLNTNNNTVRFMVFDSTGSGSLLGTTPQWAYDVPYAGTNSAGFVLPIPGGGQRFSNGITYTVTKGSTTNTAPDGPILVNSGWKP